MKRSFYLEKFYDSKYKLIRVSLTGAAFPYIQLYLFCPLDIWGMKFWSFAPSKKSRRTCFNIFFIITCYVSEPISIEFISQRTKGYFLIAEIWEYKYIRQYMYGYMYKYISTLPTYSKCTLGCSDFYFFSYSWECLTFPLFLGTQEFRKCLKNYFFFSRFVRIFSNIFEYLYFFRTFQN